MATSTARARQAFSPLRSVRKSDEVFEQLTKLVRDGTFPPGGRLPAERDLATQINASRQTIREALYRAELAGMIEVRHGAGSFVVSASGRPGLETPVLELIARQADRIGEFFEIRRLVEGWCVAKAAKRAKKADLRTMQRILERMRGYELDDPLFEQNDIDFHVTIAHSTGNPLAVRMIEILRGSFSALYRLKEMIPKREDKDLVLRHHWNIYDALRRRSPKAAKRAIIAHMDYIERQLQASVRDMK